MYETHQYIFLPCRHGWSIGWSVGSESHTAHVKLKHTKTLFGMFNIFSLNIDAIQTGPSLVNLNLSCMLGKGVMMQYILPLEHNVQKLVHVFYTQISWVPPYAKVGWTRQYSENLKLQEEQ